MTDDFLTDQLRSSLKKNNYTLKAKSKFPTGISYWWMAWYKKKIESYQEKTKGNFSIIAIDSLHEDGYFIIPYKLVKPFLLEQYLDDDQKRWNLSIRHHNLCIHNSDVKIPIERYHFHGPLSDIERNIQTLSSEIILNDKISDAFSKKDKPKSNEKLLKNLFYWTCKKCGKPLLNNPLDELDELSDALDVIDAKRATQITYSILRKYNLSSGVKCRYCDEYQLKRKFRSPDIFIEMELENNRFVEKIIPKYEVYKKLQNLDDDDYETLGIRKRDLIESFDTIEKNVTKQPNPDNLKKHYSEEESIKSPLLTEINPISPHFSLPSRSISQPNTQKTEQVTSSIHSLEDLFEDSPDQQKTNVTESEDTYKTINSIEDLFEDEPEHKDPVTKNTSLVDSTNENEEESASHRLKQLFKLELQKSLKK